MPANPNPTGVASTIYTGQATVSSQQLLLPGRPGRRGLVISNAGNNDVQVGGSDTVTIGNGFNIAAKTSTPFIPYDGPVFIVSASADLVSWVEFI
jgi:hypothetical protein